MLIIFINLRKKTELALQKYGIKTASKHRKGSQHPYS